MSDERVSMDHLCTELDVDGILVNIDQEADIIDIEGITFERGYQLRVMTDGGLTVMEGPMDWARSVAMGDGASITYLGLLEVSQATGEPDDPQRIVLVEFARMNLVGVQEAETKGRNLARGYLTVQEFVQRYLRGEIGDVG